MFKLFTYIILSFLSAISVYNNSNNINNKESNVKVEEKNAILMHIEIPKISVSQDIYGKDSKLNDIDKNVIIMKESDYPDEVGGMVIIGGHSGYGKYAYFKNLNLLKTGDEIIIKYRNIKYKYKVINYYLDKKDGSINISKSDNKSKLFLYTCNPNDKKNYLVIVCELI